jgi:hypothetical protein
MYVLIGLIESDGHEVVEGVKEENVCGSVLPCSAKLQ